MRRCLLGWAGLVLLALVGCGAGDSNMFGDFFGDGTSPGSSFDVAQPGRVTGFVVTRDSDGRVLILGSLADATVPVTPLAGVVVAIPEQNLTQTTGADGSYSFDSVQPGDLTLRFTLPPANGGTTASFAFRLDPAETIAGLPAGANL